MGFTFARGLFTILNHEINLEIVLSSDINLTLDFQKEMLALEKVGIKFAVKNSAICLDYLYAQVILEDKIISLFNQDNSIFEFNENWLESVSPSYQSMIYPSLEIQPFSFDFNIVEQYENQYHHLKILHKFNDASISGFAQNFWNTVVPIAKLDHLINDDPIVEVKYSDRYLKSPANIILISNLFNYLKNLLEGRVKFIIQTSFFLKHYLRILSLMTFWIQTFKIIVTMNSFLSDILKISYLKRSI